jgi:hypothetical protein
MKSRWTLHLQPRCTSSQQSFLLGHAEPAHDAVGLKIVLQSRTSTKQNKCPSESRVATTLFISIVVVVHAITAVIVIVAVGGRGRHFADRSSAGFGTDC